MLNIGDDSGAALDLLGTDSQSILGSGSAIPTKFIRNELGVHHFNSDFLANKAFYMVPFCESIRGAYEGQMNGYQQFSGERLQLALTLAAAPTQEVQTITVAAAAPNAGFYRFSFRGELSEPIAFNASAATMKSTFEALRSVASRNITVTFSAALSAGTSLTATFAHPETSGLQGDKIEVVSVGLNTTGTMCNVTSAITTAGTSGIATGSYDINIYALMYKKIAYADGKLKVVSL